MERYMSEKDINSLRVQKIIGDDEIALIVDNIVIAENILTRTRRHVNAANIILETRKTLLRD